MTMPYRINGPEEIESTKLLFWPNNPRLKISDFSEIMYSDKELLEPSNQKKIFKLLSKHEDHDVLTLIKSMCKVGFMREKAPIVMKLNGSDSYLVLEGNRRLTAIKTILSDKSIQISSNIKNSLETIPCWIFDHISKDVPLKSSISRMVAEAHIKGQKPHSKLQRAHMLYDAYEGFLADKNMNHGFVLDKDALDATAHFFDFPVKELEGDLSVVRLYKQLVEVYEFEDIPKKCSERLSWVHKNQGQFKKYFGYDSNILCFDEEGIERFYDLFLQPEAAVYNPLTFKKFLNVMRNGEYEDIESIRDEPDMLIDIDKRIREHRSDSRFLLGLEGIEKRLKTLRISDFNKSSEEICAINRIVSLVDNKLKRLSPESINPSSGNESISFRFKRPDNIQEAMLLDYSHLTQQVVKVVKSRPNRSCVREKVPTFLLKEWGIKSRGRPHEAFCEHVDELLEKMIKDGHLDLYKAKNERVRI